MSGNVKASNSEGSGNAAGKPAMHWPASARVRNVHVDVFADKNKDGFVEFSHRWKFEDEPPPPEPVAKGTIDLPEGKTAYRLHFHLKDDTALDLSFIAPSSEAMWVTAGEDCPTCAGNGAGQILFTHPDNPHQLVVDDLNSNVPAMKFKYALRFDGKDGYQAGNPPKEGPPYEYDPDFKNGGGNT